MPNSEKAKLGINDLIKKIKQHNAHKSSLEIPNALNIKRYCAKKTKNLRMDSKLVITKILSEIGFNEFSKHFKNLNQLEIKLIQKGEYHKNK